jgi:hypothetical protein
MRTADTFSTRSRQNKRPPWRGNNANPSLKPTSQRAASPQRVEKSQSLGGSESILVQPVAFEWPLHKAQPSVASQDNEWPVQVAAVRGCKA